MTETILDDSAVGEIEARDWHLNGALEKRIALSPAERDALCATVRHLRELAYVPKILPDDDEVTFQAHSARLLREKMELQSQLEQLRAENGRLREADARIAESFRLGWNSDNTFRQVAETIAAAIRAGKGS